jgi:CPA2 family monovalent cation:H+ antiporter-2/glutathione-regulated potassium-efflux system protein KefB
MAEVHVRAYDRIHALELIERGADRFMRETFESALAFGGEALAGLQGDREAALSIVADVRLRDYERLALQQAGGLYADMPYSSTVRPEPLTKPARPARALNPETRDIVDATAAREAAKDTAS